MNIIQEALKISNAGECSRSWILENPTLVCLAQGNFTLCSCSDGKGKKRATGAKTVVLLVEHISFSGFLITIRNVILQN